MKKILTVLSALALSLSLASAQTQNQYGDGTGTMDGSGPHGDGTMWENLTDAIAAVEDVDLKTSLETALATANDLRVVLRDAHVGYEGTIEEFRVEYADQIADLKTAVETLRDWWRENRPDRPDPVMTGEMERRRLRYQDNSGELVQLRQQLRQELGKENPDQQVCEQIREQIRQTLGERKGLLREKRRGEGGQSGDGNRKRGG